MSLIKLPSSVYQTIITHALSHENEEIMGLLCAEDLESYINIYAAFPFRRTTHQPDRVEIEDDDMISGLVKASEMGKKLNKELLILGWYHSHPNTTVKPSEIDLATQRNYEQLNSKFFGIIVSVFNNDKCHKKQIIDFTCFRSHGSESIKLVIEPTPEMESSRIYYDICMQTWQSIPSVLLEEMSKDSDDCARFNRMLQFRERIIFPMTTTCENLQKSMTGELITVKQPPW